MNGTLRVRGGKKLQGTVTPIPNKNSIVAALPVCILTDEVVTYKNLPNTTDVQKEIEILRLLGAEVDDSDFNSVKICCKNMTSYELDGELGAKFRASIMFAGALLARFGKAKLPLPGGCLLGFRSIAAHVDVFRRMGVEVTFEGESVTFTRPKKILSNYRIWQMEASVTATENLIIYAAGIDSEVEVLNACCEPHVTSVLKLVQSLGAKVDGIGSNRLRIAGGNLQNAVEFEADPDFVDMAGYIVAAAVTGGNITLKNANIPDIVDNLITRFSIFNIDITKEGSDVIIDGSKEHFIDLQTSGIPMAGKDLPKIYPNVWPSLPVDVLPVVVTLCCKSKGKFLVGNWMYESGLDFYKELNMLGADIFMCDPTKILVTGPVSFHGGTITSPEIIQACKALFLAAISDNVETTIHGVDILKRRYPDIVTVYKSLGADITELA